MVEYFVIASRHRCAPACRTSCEDRAFMTVTSPIATSLGDLPEAREGELVLKSSAHAMLDVNKIHVDCVGPNEFIRAITGVNPNGFASAGSP